jgi:hypothetical protein
MNRPEIAGDSRTGVPSEMAAKMKALERENRSMRTCDRVARPIPP